MSKVIKKTIVLLCSIIAGSGVCIISSYFVSKIVRWFTESYIINGLVTVSVTTFLLVLTYIAFNYFIDAIIDEK